MFSLLYLSLSFHFSVVYLPLNFARAVLHSYLERCTTPDSDPVAEFCSSTVPFPVSNFDSTSIAEDCPRGRLRLPREKIRPLAAASNGGEIPFRLPLPRVFPLYALTAIGEQL